MINKESEIIHLLAKQPWRKLTFTEIKLESKKKSKSYVDRVLKKLETENIIKKDTVGHLPVYSLNLPSQKAKAYAGFILEHFSWNKKYIPYKPMQQAMDKIPTHDFIYIITGSYAKKKQKPTSDIDVVIIIDDSLNPQNVYARLRQFCELRIPEIHLYVFKNKEFIEMLVNDEPNYGKEIVKNFLILSGGQIFLSLIQEAMSRGFKNS